MERKLRQRRKSKLSKLRIQFGKAKSQDAKERILAKAEIVSPNIVQSQFSTLWA